MSSLLTVTLRIGAASAEPLTRSFQRLYDTVAGALVGEQCQSVGGARRETVPISNQALIDAPGTVRAAIARAVKEYDVTPDLILVDAAHSKGLARGTLLVHLASALAEILDQPAQFGLTSPPKLTILLLPEAPPPPDPVRLALQKHLMNGSVIIVSNDGAVVPDSRCPEGFEEKYRLHLARLSEDPERLLKFKLIRRLGHFRRKAGKPRGVCARYFYDGSLCVDEIVELFKRFIATASEAATDARVRAERPTVAVAYYSPMSPWLEEAMVILGQSTSHPVQRIESLLSSLAGDAGKPSAVVLCLDMVETGATLQDLVQGLRVHWDVEDIFIASVLSTKSTDIAGRRRAAMIRNPVTNEVEEFEVRYFQLVTQQSWTPAECPLCRLGIRESSEVEATAMLTAYDFHDLVRESNVGPENDVPSHRPPLRVVPRFPEILDKHGALLATKVRDCLRLCPVGYPADPVALCPGERGSRVFTDYLRLVLGIAIIEVPRPVITVCAKADRAAISAMIERATEEKDAWFVELASVTTSHVILLDEFNGSGATARGLARLATEFGRSVHCYFPLVNFDPEGSRLPFPVLTLYEFAASFVA